MSLTFNKGTLSFSGDIMAKMSLVKVGGAPGSVAGEVPNSKLHKNDSETRTMYLTSVSLKRLDHMQTFLHVLNLPLHDLRGLWLRTRHHHAIIS